MTASVKTLPRPPGQAASRGELSALKIDRSQRRRRSPFKLLAILFVAALGTAGAMGYQRLRDQLQPAQRVKTDAVRVLSVGQARAVLTATGYLESRRHAAVGAKASGRIKELLFEEGTEVKKGDLLAVLEHDDQVAMLDHRRVMVEQTQAELAQARRQLQQRERDFGREQQIHRRGAGTDAALETAETDFHMARLRVDSLSASVRAAEAQVREMEQSIRNMHIYAPFDGTVIDKEAEVGETITPGGMGAASGRGSVATLADLNALEVDTDVKEDYLAQLSRGQPAEVAVDAVSQRRYRGRLREIVPMGDRTRGIVKVKVEILDADQRLFPDLSATVHFLPPDAEDQAASDVKALFVPPAALVTAEGGLFVWRLKESRAERVPVKRVGEPSDGLVRVEGDLAGGDTIVVEPPADLRADVPVVAEGLPAQ
ncbi:MAG TPA: efflux RND transporter periplasmic adaptor subunit [Pirellulales bacterium]|nr:efflux RND transporter periplasmic adaptor subunit [Pirellulales bacterium]